MTSWPNGSKTIPRVSGEYGPRVAPIAGASTFHRGIDLVGWANNKSPVAGVVTFAAYNGSAGNMLTIKGDNGDTFIIMHNARFLVGVGQRVAEGQDVGVMGTTGASTGVHCHFETHPGGGEAINPRVFMATATVAGGKYSSIEADDPTEKDDDMRIVWTLQNGKRQTAWFVGPAGPKGIPTPQVLGLLQRVIADVNSTDNFFEAEIAMIAPYFINPSVVDTTPIVAAVVNAIKATGTPIAQLTDADIARIAKGVNDDEAKRLTA